MRRLSRFHCHPHAHRAAHRGCDHLHASECLGRRQSGIAQNTDEPFHGPHCCGCGWTVGEQDGQRFDMGQHGVAVGARCAQDALFWRGYRVIDRQIDSSHDCLNDGVEQRLFVGNVIVDRHRVDAQFRAKPPHGEPVEAVAVHQRQRSRDNLLALQRLIRPLPALVMCRRTRFAPDSASSVLA